MTWVCCCCSAELVAEANERPAWCPACLRSGTLVRPTRRRITEAISAAAKPVSAADVVAQSWSLKRCPTTGLAWSHGAMILLYGSPGGGKSSLALQMIAQVSPVLIASLEEGAGPPLARRLALASMGGRRDVTVHPRPSLQDMLVAAGRGHGIVVDSISLSSLTPADLRGVVDAGCPLLVGVLHATKAGDARGSLSLIHECDIVIQVERGHWKSEKNRYGPSGLGGSVRGVDPLNQEEVQHGQ